jgi:hypothetical protein
MLLKKGSRGQEVIDLQRALGIEADGIFGPATEAEVKKFQQENGLAVDGIVGSQTFAAIQDGYATTDHSERVYSPYKDLVVSKYFLPKDEYLTGPTSKEYLFLHHTAGSNNPYRTVDIWTNDNRGKIATEFVLGGRSIRGNEDLYDGELVQCVPEGGYGWHLGSDGSHYMHTHSVAIELCNIGYAVNGISYVGVPIAADQIVTLSKPFRGYTQFHTYSDKQLETLKLFILWIAERDSIDVRVGLISEIKQKGVKAFEFNEDAYYGRTKGMWTHTNILKDKSDLSPQPKLIDMLLSL